MAPRQNAPVDPAILDFMIATNQYGTGTGYEADDFNDEQKKLNYIQDLFYTGQFNLNDLLGIPEAPEDPGAAPVYSGFQNDMRNQYGANPVLNRAFGELDAGADPFTTATAIRELIAEQPELQQYLPTYVSNDQYASGDPQLDTQQLETLLTTYAANRERQMREQTQYAQQLADYEKQADAFHVYNNPVSEYELRGAPSLGQDISAMKSQVDPKNFRGRAPLEQTPAQELDLDSLFSGSPKTEAVRQIGQPMSQGLVQSPNRQGPKQLSYGGNDMIAKMARYRQGAQQRNVRPSGRELDNRKRQQAIYMLMNGEVA